MNKFSSTFYVQFYLPKDQSVNMFLLNETTGLNFLCIFLNRINLYSNNHSLNLSHKLLFIQMYSIWEDVNSAVIIQKLLPHLKPSSFPWIISNYDNKIPWFSWKLCLLCWTCCIYFRALLVSMAIKIMYKMETSLVFHRNFLFLLPQHILEQLKANKCHKRSGSPVMTAQIKNGSGREGTPG